MTDEPNKMNGFPTENQREDLPADRPADMQPDAPVEAVTPVDVAASEPAPVSPIDEQTVAGDVPGIEAKTAPTEEVEAAEDAAPVAETELAVGETAEEAAEPDAEKTSAEEPAEPEPPSKSDKMDWYILKVQSNREDSIRDGLLRRVAIADLDYYFGDVIVPTEKVTEFKGGKKKVIKRKLYPGYIVVHMEINDDTWFLVRETPGIGDFTGAAGRPSPMLPHEVDRILVKQEEKSEKAPKLKIAFAQGDRVKIKEGTFENFEGEVDAIDETNGRVTVMINIFGRSTPVELEYWQIEAL